MIIEQLRSKTSGETAAQYVSSLREAYLEDIGMDLGMIVSEGKIDFGLDGPHLIAFIRFTLKELVHQGARPHHIGLPQPWYTHLYYGENEDAIVEGVINDWVNLGMPDLKWGDFWFAWPGSIEAIPAKDWYRAP